MAMTSFLTSLRMQENSASEAAHQWLQYDVLFDQLIDSEPAPFSLQGGPNGNVSEACRSPGYIEYLEGRSGSRHSAGLNGMSFRMRPPDSSSYGHARALISPPPSSADSTLDTGSPQLGGGDKLAESQRLDAAVPLPLDVTRTASCEAPNKDLVASDPLPFQQSLPITPPLTEHNYSFGSSAKSVLSGGIQKTYRKGSISPTRMAHPSFSRQNSEWARKLESTPDLDIKPSLRHDFWSPPPSARIPQWDDTMAFGTSSSSYSQSHSSRSGSYQQSQASANSASGTRQQSRTLPSQRQTPVSTPYSASSSSFDPLITSPQVDGSLAWDSAPFSPYQQYSIDASPVSHQYDESKVQPWFPSTQSAPLYNTYGHHAYTQRHSSQHSDNIPTLPSQDSYNAASVSPSQSIEGLGINTTSGSESSSFPLYSSMMGNGNYCTPSQTCSQQQQLAPAQQATDRRQRSSSAESSTPPSPNAQARSTLTGRRAARPHTTGRRSKSQGNAASAKTVSVGFVNFTPHDSKRILTGVAPSGSSKTKARREKEAADRRRQLGQAAARAVLEAGGDPAALEREGLFAYA